MDEDGNVILPTGTAWIASSTGITSTATGLHT